MRWSPYTPEPEKGPAQKPDWAFPDLAATLTPKSTGDVDFRPYCTDTHQKDLPSCAGNATADSIEILSALQGHPKVELSRLFVWSLARSQSDRDGDGRGDINLKTGIYIRQAFDVTKTFGICLEEHWPYDVSKWDVLPSLKAMREAARRKIKAYYRIRAQGHERVEQILQALRSGHPVVFGTPVTEAFQTFQGVETWTVPKGPTIGGHAMVVVGWDASKGFIVKNSWGRNWGEGGYAYFAPEYLAWERTHDIWVPTIGRNFG